MLNKMFDLRHSFITKGCDGGEVEKWKKKIIVKIAVHYRRASQPLERRLTGTLVSINSPSIDF